MTETANVYCPADDRLKLVARCAAMVQRNIEICNGVYSPMLSPNLQSVMDLCVVDDSLVPPEVEFEVIEKQLAKNKAVFSSAFQSKRANKVLIICRIVGTVLWWAMTPLAVIGLLDVCKYISGLIQ